MRHHHYPASLMLPSLRQLTNASGGRLVWGAMCDCFQDLGRERRGGQEGIEGGRGRKEKREEEREEKREEEKREEKEGRAWPSGLRKKAPISPGAGGVGSSAIFPAERRKPGLYSGTSCHQSLRELLSPILALHFIGMTG